MPKKPTPPEGEVNKNNMPEVASRQAEVATIRKSVLQPQHIGFVNLYFACNFNIVEAARRMDLPLPMCKRWVEEEGPVSEYISRRLTKMSERTDVTLEEIISLLLKEATREAEGKDDKTVSHAARVSALASLARIKGGFDKKAPTGRKVSVNINIGDTKGAPVAIDGNEQPAGD